MVSLGEFDEFTRFINISSGPHVVQLSSVSFLLYDTHSQFVHCFIVGCLGYGAITLNKMTSKVHLADNFSTNEAGIILLNVYRRTASNKIHGCIKIGHMH